MNATFLGPNNQPRCSWCSATPEYLAYHDTEWGFPVSDDRRLFEKFSLEGFQSGLSWRTILTKRENFRAAFHHFDFDQIARCTERDASACAACATAKPGALQTAVSQVAVTRRRRDTAITAGRADPTVGRLGFTA